MIRYALKCPQGHGFESWFAASAAYERLRVAGHVTCPVCGSAEVDKALMAPQLAPERVGAMVQPQPAGAAQEAAPAADADTMPVVSDPRAVAIARLRAEVEKNSEYVGGRFAQEARRIHTGDAPERTIHGEARPDEARALIEEGVPIAPLPFATGRKVN
jgi:hypothetical protein